MLFKDKLRALMDRDGLGQQDVAEKLGVSHPAVAGWLSGAKPRSKRFRQLAELFDVPPEKLSDDSATMFIDPPRLKEGMRRSTTSDAWLARALCSSMSDEDLLDLSGAIFDQDWMKGTQKAYVMNLINQEQRRRYKESTPEKGKL